MHLCVQQRVGWALEARLELATPLARSSLPGLACVFFFFFQPFPSRHMDAWSLLPPSGGFQYGTEVTGGFTEARKKRKKKKN